MPHFSYSHRGEQYSLPMSLPQLRFPHSLPPNMTLNSACSSAALATPFFITGKTSYAIRFLCHSSCAIRLVPATHWQTWLCWTPENGQPAVGMAPCIRVRVSAIPNVCNKEYHLAGTLWQMMARLFSEQWEQMRKPLASMATSNFRAGYIVSPCGSLDDGSTLGHFRGRRRRRDAAGWRCHIILGGRDVRLVAIGCCSNVVFLALLRLRRVGTGQVCGT